MVDVTHGSVATFGSQESDDTIASADYLLAVKVGKQGEPVIVRVLLKAPLKALPTTDLSYKATLPAGTVMLPQPDELLHIVNSDATNQYCTNVGGRWVWINPVVTAMSV